MKYWKYDHDKCITQAILLPTGELLGFATFHEKLVLLAGNLSYIQIKRLTDDLIKLLEKRYNNDDTFYFIEGFLQVYELVLLATFKKIEYLYGGEIKIPHYDKKRPASFNELLIRTTALNLMAGFINKIISENNLEAEFHTHLWDIANDLGTVGLEMTETRFKYLCEEEIIAVYMKPVYNFKLIERILYQTSLLSGITNTGELFCAINSMSQPFPLLVLDRDSTAQMKERIQKLEIFSKFPTYIQELYKDPNSYLFVGPFNTTDYDDPEHNLMFKTYIAGYNYAKIKKLTDAIDDFDEGMEEFISNVYSQIREIPFELLRNYRKDNINFMMFIQTMFDICRVIETEYDLNVVKEFICVIGMGIPYSRTIITEYVFTGNIPIEVVGTNTLN